MPDVPVLHREQLPISGTWSPRPPTLAGITPIAVLVWGQFIDSVVDDSALPGNSFFIGMSDGVDGYCRSSYSMDGAATYRSIQRETGNNLIVCGDDTSPGIIWIEVETPTLVPGGFDAVLTTTTNRPYVNMLFFHGANWQVHMERTEGILSGTRTITTGFSGTGNNNQVAFFLPSINSVPSSQITQKANETGATLGIACRNTSVITQGATAIGHRHNNGTAFIGQMASGSRCLLNCSYNSIKTALECTDFTDNSIVLTHRAGTQSRGAYVLALETDDTRVWAGVVDSLTANGAFTVSGPNFPGGAALLSPSQADTDGDVLKTSDIAIGGLAGGDVNGDYSAGYSDQDGVGTSVSKSIQDDQFMNFLQDDGTSGWKSGPSDFALTGTGFEVTNVVVGGGATAIARKWLAFVSEAAAAGPVVLNVGDLLHAHPVDIANLTPSTYRLFGEDLVHAQPVGSISLNRIISLAANGLLHAQPIGSANVFSQSNPVLNIDSLIHAQPVESSYFGRYLRADDLLHTNALGQAEVTVNKGLTTDDLVHAQPVDTVGLAGSPDFVLNAQNLLHQQPVASATLPKQTTLLAQGLVHGQPVDSVDLLVGGQTYPYINAQQGMLVFTWKPRYSKADMTIPPDVLALVGLSASKDVLFRLFYGVTSALQSLDGTSTVGVDLDAGAGPREGIAYRCALRWNTSTPARQIGYLAEDAGGVWVWGTEGSYDGKFGEGALRVFYDNQYPQLVSDILIYNQDAGRDFIEGLPREF